MPTREHENQSRFRAPAPCFMLSMNKILLLILIEYLVDASVAAADPVVFNLGGPRKVVAKISIVGEEYRIDVRMLAVQAFDNAMNDRLNREKARILALQALVRHVSGKNEAEASVSGVRILASGTDKSYFTLTLALPMDKFSLVEASTPRKPNSGGKFPDGEERLKWKSELFTKKDDYFRTIEVLKSEFLNDIARAAKAPKEFDTRIADTEVSSAKAFDALRKEIASEILLLTIEMEELNGKAKDAEQQVMTRLKLAVEENDKKDAKFERKSK